MNDPSHNTTLPETMKGVCLTGHGGPEKLDYREDLPVPVPSLGEVLIRVAAAGVNNTDMNTRIGWYSKGGEDTDATWSGGALSFPRIQGADVCGVIVAVGSGVDQARIGERVLIEPCLQQHGNGEALAQPWYFGSECHGGFAQFTTVASVYAHTINSDLSDMELASFPCSYSTAENMLTKSNVVAGETVLVTGASGGVGSAAVQLANARGATVIAITSPAKGNELLKLGASKIVGRSDRLLDALGTNSVDVVIDLVAGPQWPDLLDVLKPGGRYAVAGAIAGPMVELDVRTLYLKDLTFFGCTVLRPNVFANLVRIIEQGKIQPLVAHCFPLERIHQAQEAFLQKKHIGKIVLSVPE